MRSSTSLARRSRPVEDHCQHRIYSFAAFVCSEKDWVGPVPLPDLCISRPAPARGILPLTGKDKIRGDGLIDSRAPLSLPFPIKGKESDYDAAIPAISPSVEKSKFIDHLVRK